MEDQTFVYGHDAGTARMLLAAADRLGLPAHVVRSTDSGFFVPDRVWSAVEQALTAPPPEAAF